MTKPAPNNRPSRRLRKVPPTVPEEFPVPSAFAIAPSENVACCARRRIAFAFLAALASAVGFSVRAEEAPLAIRMQSISLEAGWNAVFLDVDPAESKPDAVFDGTPIDVAARLFVPISQVRFISDPAISGWNREEWGVWYAPDREDAFLSNLHAVQGGHCYLVHSDKAFTWSVTGTVRHRSIRWKADAYNLVGFNLREENPPSFASFFAGSEGAVGSRILRLQNGKWRPVADPAAERMRPGEACWVHCGRRTDFQGPIALSSVPATGSIDLGTTGYRFEIACRNTSAAADEVRVEIVSGAPNLPVDERKRTTGSLATSSAALPATFTLGEIARGAIKKLDLQLRRERLGPGRHSALFKFSSASGAVAWVPVYATGDTP